MAPDLLSSRPSPPPSALHQRIARELACLTEGGQKATLCRGTLNRDEREFVVYADVPVVSMLRTTRPDLPAVTDVIAPVPAGYPSALIDLAGLPLGSPLMPLVRGGTNPQGLVTTGDGRTWQLASYHPHQNGGGPPWNPMEHGFHTYLEHLLSWLARLS